jgi:hypothetical protein
MQTMCSIPPSFTLGPFKLSDIVVLALMLLCAGLVFLVLHYIASSNKQDRNQRRNYRNDDIGRG